METLQNPSAVELERELLSLAGSTSSSSSLLADGKSASKRVRVAEEEDENSNEGRRTRGSTAQPRRKRISADDDDDDDVDDDDGKKSKKQKGHDDDGSSGSSDGSDDSSDSSSSSDSDSDDQFDEDWGGGSSRKKKKKSKKHKNSKHGKRGKRKGNASDSDSGLYDDSDDSDDSDDDDDDDDDDNDEDGDAGYSKLAPEDQELLKLGEDYMGDEADRAKLFAMNDVEREQVLFERSERIAKLKEKQMILKTLRETRKRQKFGKTGKKSMSSSSSKSDKAKSKKKNKKKHKKSKEEKSLSESSSKRKRNKSASDGGDGRGSTGDASADVDDDEEEDVDEYERRRQQELEEARAKAKADPTLDELNSIRLSRHKLLKWMFDPKLPEVANGCFLRVNIGTYQSEATYRIVEIRNINEGPKIYEVDKIRTNRVVEVDYCGSIRNMRLEFVSNKDFTPGEFAKWVNDMKQSHRSLPNVAKIQAKRKVIRSYIEHEYTSQEVEEIVANKSKLRVAPSNFAIEKAALESRIKIIEYDPNKEEELERLRAELADLDRRSDEIYRKQVAKLASIALVNERNRTKNSDDTGKVAGVTLLADGVEDEENDVFERRACRPALVIATKESTSSAPADANTTVASSAEIVEKVKEQQPPIRRESVEVLKDIASKKDIVAIQKSLFAAASGASTHRPAAGSKNAFSNPFGSPFGSSKLENYNKEGNKQSNTDLFSMHDFDLGIDIKTPTIASVPDVQTRRN